MKCSQQCRYAVNKANKELLEKVQRRFTKTIQGMKGKSYQERLQKLSLWSLEERRNRQDLIEVFKICKGFSRIRPEELFQFDDRGKGTRGYSLKLVKVRCTRDSRRHFFSNRVIKRWNELGQEAVDATSIQRL